MSSKIKMTSGYDASLPLTVSNVDMFYALSKNLIDNVKQNIRMLFLTSPGERIMEPGYGVGFRNFLFEQRVESDIVATINTQVAIYMPNIKILRLTVNNGDVLTQSKTGQNNTLVVNFTYEIAGTNIRDSIVFSDELIDQ